MDFLIYIAGLAKDNPDMLKDLMKMGIAFLLVKREMGKQFDGLKEEIKNLTAAFQTLETKHDLRITNLEHEMKELKERQ